MDMDSAEPGSDMEAEGSDMEAEASVARTGGSARASRAARLSGAAAGAAEVAATAQRKAETAGGALPPEQLRPVEEMVTVGLRAGCSGVVTLLVVPASSQAADRHKGVSGAQPRELRARLSFGPRSALVRRALGVLRAAAPAEAYLAFMRRVHASAAAEEGGGGTGGCDVGAREWAAFTAVLLHWAAEGEAFEAGTPRALAASQAAARVAGARGPAPVATPLNTRRFAAMSLASPPPPRGGGAAAAAPSAWEAMLASSTQAALAAAAQRSGPGGLGGLARLFATGSGAPAAPPRVEGDAAAAPGAARGPVASLSALLEAEAEAAHLPTTPAAPEATPPDAAPSTSLLAALSGLHGLYEELKLDALTWRGVRPLGVALAAAASALRAHRHWEHYARDLGPGQLAAAGAPEPPLADADGAAHEGGLSRCPADMLRCAAAVTRRGERECKKERKIYAQKFVKYRVLYYLSYRGGKASAGSGHGCTLDTATRAAPLPARHPQCPGAPAEGPDTRRRGAAVAAAAALARGPNGRRRSCGCRAGRRGRCGALGAAAELAAAALLLAAQSGGPRVRTTRSQGAFARSSTALHACARASQGPGSGLK